MMEKVHSVGTLASSSTLREFANQSLRQADGGGTLLLDDSVEISDLATFLNRLSELPESRARRIVAVRNQIQGGTYESPEKLDIATDRLLTQL
jgi:Anti-sigma-28 factor, FlgM